MIFQGRGSQFCQTDGCCSEYGMHNMCLIRKCLIAGSCKLNVVLNICDMSLERCSVSKGLTNIPLIVSDILSYQHWTFKLRSFLYTLDKIKQISNFCRVQQTLLLRDENIFPIYHFHGYKDLNNGIRMWLASKNYTILKTNNPIRLPPWRLDKLSHGFYQIKTQNCVLRIMPAFQILWEGKSLILESALLSVGFNNHPVASLQKHLLS